jgi:hypothetical protein
MAELKKNDADAFWEKRGCVVVLLLLTRDLLWKKKNKNNDVEVISRRIVYIR